MTTSRSASALEDIEAIVPALNINNGAELPIDRDRAAILLYLYAMVEAERVTISAHLGIPNLNLGRRIRTLKHDGYIWQTHSPRNARHVLVGLTPKGVRMAQEVIKVYQENRNRLSDILHGRQQGSDAQASEVSI